MSATHCKCGRRVDQPLGGKPRKYCSLICAKKAQHEAIRQWYLRNKEAHCESAKQRYLINKEARLRENRMWRENNPIRARENSKLYQRQRRLDFSFRLGSNLRGRIRAALKGILKAERTFKLLGCTSAKLWSHLESKFVSGMARENYGPIWHVDHIRPCASFDLSDPEQQKICFHYSNLQPLFAKDNRKKGAKWTP